MKVSVVIPARYQSSRLPGKPLADIAGDPMIRWVYERATKAQRVHEVWVATDDERIKEAIDRFGGKCCMTSPDHCSGTDRIAEVANDNAWDIVVNVQGDEPLIHPEMIDAVVTSLEKNETASMSTLKRNLTEPDELLDPNVVKVVTDYRDRALYFSRAPIPYHRDTWKTLHEINRIPLSDLVFKHVGIYGYRRDVLIALASLPPTPLELTEKLEQLRALENGYTIIAETTHKDSVGVDSPDDLERVRKLVNADRCTCIPKEEYIV